MHCHPAGHVQELNFPLQARGAVPQGGTTGVARSYLWFKKVTLGAPRAGIVWKKAGVNEDRSLGGTCNSQLRIDKNLFILDPRPCIVS